MNEENTRKLLEAAPKLFSGFHPEREQMLKGLRGEKQDRPFMPIAFGFECGDGWFDLLFECSTKIEAVINSYPEKDQVHFYATQVKEKFGTLRFYMSGFNDEIDAIISEADMKSAVTCEECGKPGQLRGTGWLVTLCEEHADGRPLYGEDDDDESDS